jgi:hypothetical protein
VRRHAAPTRWRLIGRVGPGSPRSRVPRTPTRAAGSWGGECSVVRRPRQIKVSNLLSCGKPHNGHEVTVARLAPQGGTPPRRTGALLHIAFDACSRRAPIRRQSFGLALPQFAREDNPMGTTPTARPDESLQNVRATEGRWMGRNPFRTQVDSRRQNRLSACLHETLAGSLRPKIGL